MWAKALDIQDGDNIERHYRVVALLSTLRDEVRLAQAAAAHTSVRPIKYQAAFEAVHNALNLDYLTGSFDAIHSHIRPDVLSTLSILADIIPNDGAPVDQEELNSIVAQLEELERDIENADLPEEARRFFLSQIRILLTAIRRYPIVGSKAFQEALGFFFAAVAQNQEAVRQATEDERTTQTMERLQKHWIWCMARANDAAVIYTLVDLGKRLLGGS